MSAGREMIAVLFCAVCGSHRVDVFGTWPDGRRVLHCCACHHEASVQGFTVGRVWDVPAAVVRLGEEDRAGTDDHKRAWAFAALTEIPGGYRLGRAVQVLADDAAEREGE